MQVLVDASCTAGYTGLRLWPAAVQLARLLADGPAMKGRKVLELGDPELEKNLGERVEDVVKPPLVLFFLLFFFLLLLIQT